MHRGIHRALIPTTILVLLPACGTPPPPPVEVDTRGIDPEAAELIHELRRAAADDPGRADRRAELGYALEANGLPRAAIRTYLQVERLAPDDPRWSYLAAVVSAQLGELDTAIDAVDRSLAIDPGYVAAHLYRGAWLLDLGKADRAGAAYERALRLEPDNRAALYGQARVHLQRDDGAQALAILERLAGSNRSDRYLQQLLGSAYRLTGDLERAGEALALGRGQAQPPAWPDPRRGVLQHYARGYAAEMRRADALLDAGRWQEAAGILEQLRGRNPADPDLLVNLATAYRRLGRQEESIGVLDAGLEQRPDHVRLHVNRAFAYEQSGELDRALEHLDRAIESNPKQGFVYVRKGKVLLYKLRRLEEAVAAFEQAVRHDSRDVGAHLHLGLALGEVEREREAADRLEQALRLDPTMVEALLPLAFYRMELGQFDRAAAALGRAEQLAPGSAEVARLRGRLEQKRKEAG
jgi:tetratricopeptide (TPR) repeat protein